MLHAIVDGDRGVLHDELTDDVRVWTPEVSVSGRGELVGALERRDDAFSDVVLDVVALDVGGDYACAEWTVELVHSGRIELPDGSTAEPTGRRVVLHGVAIAEFNSGRVCALRQYWDRFGLLDQIGPAPR